MPRSAGGIVKDYVRRDYQCVLGDRTALEIVELLLRRLDPDAVVEVFAEARGRDLMSGLPKTIVLSALELRDVIRGS